MMATGCLDTNLWVAEILDTDAHSFVSTYKWIVRERMNKKGVRTEGGEYKEAF